MPTIREPRIAKPDQPKNNQRIHPEEEENRPSQKIIDNLIKKINDKFANNILEIPEVRKLVVGLGSETNISKVRRAMDEILEYVDLALNARNQKIQQIQKAYKSLEKAYKSLEESVARDEQLAKPTVSMVESQNTRAILKLSPEEVQTRRDQVREMISREQPLEGIPLYEGKKIHEEAIPFFRAHYKPYIVEGQEVIFAPDLGWIDERLLTAIRNECRAGARSPIGKHEDLTQALIDGRFLDGKRTKYRVWSAKTYRRSHDVQGSQPVIAE